MTIAQKVFLLILVFAICSCADDGGMKGTLILSITDSPIDADHVKGVNIFISSVDAKRGSEWRSVKSFDQPMGVNLLEYSGGISYPLISQPVDPGKYSAIRFNLNLSDLNSSFIRSPQCNLNYWSVKLISVPFYR